MQPAEQFTLAAWKAEHCFVPSSAHQDSSFSALWPGSQALGQCEGLSCPKSKTWPGSHQPTPVASAEPQTAPCLLCYVNLRSDTSHMSFVLGPGLDAQGLEFIAELNF